MICYYIEIPKVPDFLDSFAHYSVVKVDHCFGGAYFLHHQGDNGSISETSVNFFETTRRSISENCHIHTHRSENLKSR